MKEKNDANTRPDERIGNAKKPYKTPIVVTHGSISKLTARKKSSGVKDGGTGTFKKS